MHLAHHNFIVSGGASGLGRAVCDTITANGGHTIILDLKEPSDRPNELFFKVDITDHQAIEKIVSEILSKENNINGLINCAGISPAKKVVGKEGPSPMEFFQKVIDVNLTATFNLIRLTAAKMQTNTPNENGERGIIINTASIAAYDGQIGQAAYAASKGGIISMTLPLAREFSRSGIRVMTIAPGIFETPMVQAMPDEVKDSLLNQTVFPKRLGLPSEFAALVKHIIENSMLNGEIIRLDGSVRMGSS